MKDYNIILLGTAQMTDTACRNILHFFIVTNLLLTIAELADIVPGNHLEENDVQYVILPEPKCLTGIRIDEHQALRIRSMDYQSTNRYDQWSNIDFTIGKESITFQNYINTASLRIIRNPETDPKNKPELLDRLIYCPADHQYQNESKKRKMFNQSVLERMIGASRYKRQSQGLASKLIKTTRLALADSPYEVNSLVIVPENVDLVIEQGVTLYFEPGTGFLVRGHLIADGTFNRVIKMLPKDANSTWNGLVVETTKSFSGQNSRTVLKSLVINNAYIGLLIRGYDFPFIEDLTVAASTRDGLVVDSDFILNVTIRKCRLINNKGYGIRIKTGESTISVSINEILIAGSELTGFLLESSTTSKNLVKMIDIRNAAFFNNGWNGLDVQANYEKFQIDRTISASNGKYAIFFKTADEETLIRRSSVQISRLNVTGHWYNAALVVESSLSTFSIGRSNFWENYNGCMKFVGCMKLISIFENQYSRNRNGIISINSTCPNSSISIIRNNYTLNLLNNRILNQSIVAIHSNSSSIQFFHNNFVKNTAFNVILIEGSPKDHFTDFFLINNSFKDNLAPNIITLSSSKMNLTKNMLDNPISVCEIRILNSTMVPMENFADNIWADVNAILPGKKICLSSIKDVQNDEDNVGITGVLDVATFTSMDSKAEGMVPESLRQNMIESMTNRSMVFRARNESYKIETSLFIRNGSTMIVEPGTTLEIWPNQGIYVFGRLIANGTPNEPIIFRSRSLETWSGIYLDNDATENSSVLKYCILDRSNQGLILRSNNVILSNCVISRPKFAGVTLVIDNNSNNFESKNKKFSVQNHFVSFNFDSTKIMESQGSGLKIINSKYPIEIRSLIAEKVSGNCIDLENDPKFDIRILNSSFSDCQRYAVSIERLIGGSNQTLMLSENLIANQRGLGGVYVSGIDYGTVIVENNTFRNSLVPNLIIILKCNPWTEYVPKFDLIGNKFNLNEDLSADVRLIDCVEANITRNWFNDNNNYRHKGAFRLEIEPSPVIVNQSSGDKFNIDFRRNTFTANKGDFSVYFLTDNMNRFRSNVQFNYFRTNENRRSSLILGSPLFFVHENQFLDEKYGHKLEVEFSDDGRYLDASNNYWSTDNETEISESILDGRKIQGRGKVTFKPFLNVGNETEFMIDVPVDYNIGKNSSSVETSTLPNTPDCSSLKFCHYNGLCISNNICLCSTGYTGLDCRFFTCSTLNNCNGNGRCTGPNLCSCYEGWFGRRCDSANCSSLHECHGHGTCVSYNECECFHDYMGVDCNQTVNESTLISSSTSVLVTQSTDSQLWSFSTTLSVLENVDQNMSFQVTTAPAYCSFCNYRGRCLNEQLCLCAAGWYGRRCELANCSQVSNCSGRGLCAGPNVCQCFIGYVGEDCSTCSNGHCAKVACDKPCLHGMCDYANGTCLCKNGWTGDECGLCENGADPHTNCRKNETQITYIFTKNLDIENTILYVHGQDLPNNSVCKLDSGIMNSVWISPEYMVCNTSSPSQGAIGNFYVESTSGTKIQAPTGTNDAILSHAKPICNSGTCSEDHGSCVENLCFCDAGWKNRCEEKIVTPEMEVLSLSNISSWQEGRPLDIDFHIQNKSLKAHWQSVKIPNGATIDPETGIFHWPKPIGSNYPINITVSATTALGTSNGSYSINIRPSYTPILDQVLITSDNLLSFNGTINFDMNSSSLSKAIVDVLSYYESEDGRIVTMKIPTIADDQDQFYGEFLLDDDLLGKNLKIVACHPADCDSIVENGVDILGLKYITYDVQGLRIDPKFTSLSYDFETGQTDFQLMVENFYLYKISNIQLLARHFPTFIDWKSNATNFDLEPMEKQLIYVHIENLSSFEGFLRFEIDSPETASKYTIVELNPTISNRTRLNINGQIDTNYQFNGNNHGVITRIRAPCRGPSIADCNISIDIPPTSGLFQISRIANQRNVTGDSWFLIGYKNVSSEIIGAANESQIRLLSNGLLTQSLKFSFTPATSPTKINFKVFGEMIDSVDNQLHKIVLSLVDIQLTMFNETQHLTTDDYGMATALISNCCYGVQLRKEGYETYSTNLVIPILLNFEFFMKLLRPTSRFVVEAVYGGSSYELKFESMNLSSLTIPYIAPVKVNCRSFDTICSNVVNLRSFGVIDALNINWTSQTANASVWTMNTDRRYQEALNLSINLVNVDSSIKKSCFVVILRPTFEYMVDDRSAKQNFDLSIINNDVDQSSINLCTISTDGTMTMLPYKLREPVFCDCDTMHRKHCTKNYNSLTLCGQIWNGHTYPSMSTIVQLLAFISNCEYSGVSIDNVMNSMKCLLQQSKFCGEGSENRMQNLGWLQSMNRDLNGAMSVDMEHLIQMLHNDYQLLDVLMQYKDLLEMIKDTLKLSSFDNMHVNSWLPEFKRSITYHSELNELISNGEEHRILDSASYHSSHEKDKFRLKSFISIFNSTMRRWFKGEQFLEREIIQYSTLQNLTTNLKFLSDIAVQGFNNIFELLDGYIYDTKYAAEKESEQCLEITTRLLKVDFMENDLLQVEINVRNVRKDTDMNYLSLLVKVVDAETLNVVDQFIRNAQPPKAIRSLPYGQIWETICMIQLTPKTRLYRNLDCKIQVEIFFNAATENINSTSILYSQRFVISPRPSLKVFHFFNDSTIYPSIISFFMNNGYAKFANLSLMTTKLIMKETGADQLQTSYSLERVITDGETRILDFDQTMKNLGSGQVSYIKYDLKTDSSSYVYDFDQAVLDNGAFMEVEVEKFRVVRTLAVSRRGLPKFLIQNFSYARNDTLWVFNPDTTILQRAVPSVPSNRPIQSTRTADNATYKTLLVTFPITNLHSGEAILGSFDASLLNGTYTCIVFSSHDQEFSSGDFWIDANSKVNFVDAFLSSNISSIQYEFTFGTKINIASLNFIDPPRNLTLDFDNEIGEELVKIRTSNGRESNIRYSIFDKYNLFKIDESSGSITLNRNFPIDANDYCLTVIAQTDGSSSKAVNATTVKVIFPRKYHEEFECTPFTYNAGVPDGNSTTTIWTIHPMSTSTGSILSSGQRGPLPRETTSIPITSTNNATESSIEINEAASSRMMTISLAVTEMQTTSASTEVFSQTSTLHQTTSTFISMPTEQRESTTTDFGLQFTRNNSIMVVSTVALSQTTSQSPSYELSTLTSMRAVITPQTTNFVDHSLILQTEVSPKASDSQWKISTTEISTTVKNLPSTVTDEINNENYQPTTFASKNATFETDIDQTLIAQSISPTDIRAYNNEEMVRTACGLRHTKLVYAVICDLGKRKINSG